MALALSIVMVVSSAVSPDMIVMASESSQNVEVDAADTIEKDVGTSDEEEEALEQDGAAGIENEEEAPAADSGSQAGDSSETKSEENKSEAEGGENKSSTDQSGEEQSSAAQSSTDQSGEEQSSAAQSNEEQSSEPQSSEEQSSEEQSSEPTSETTEVTTGSGKIDVWDFGGVQQKDADMYENHVTIAFWDAYDGLGTDGKFTSTSTQFGDLTITHNTGDRLYSASEKKYAGTMSAYCTYAYSDGYTANGCYYCNGTGGDTRRYLTIENVSIGDRIDVYVGSNNTTETPFYFEYLGTDGVQKETGYATLDEETGSCNAKLSFVAKYAGQYKVWADNSGGKPIYNRAVRTHAANVEGTIDLGPLAADADFTVKFVNETTKDETIARRDGTSFSAKLAAGYQYNAVLSGATGYGFTNASKKVTVTAEEAVKGKAFIKLVVEEKQVYDYTGKITGFAQDYNLSKLNVVMKADPDSQCDDVKLKIDAQLAFSAKLEPDVIYTITLEGVNDYKVEEGKETVNQNTAYQADIKVVLKDKYAVTGKFVDPEGNEVTGVTALTFKNDEDGYEYEAELAADKKSYTVNLRDGVYSAVPVIENYKTTEHVVVEGKAVEKDILFVSTATEGALELKKDLYVGYTDKGDANYETVNKAVKAAKRMNPESEEQRITIHIAPGVYREQIIVDVPYISFVNDTPEKEVKLTWYQGIGYQYYSCVSGWYSTQDAHDKYKKGEPKNWGAAVQIKSTGFLAEHIVFEHSLNRYITEEELEDGVEPTPSGGKPERNYSLDVSSKDATERGCAMFIDSGGNNAEFYQCKFLSSQDTIGTGKEGAHAYFKECFIEGNTDYICYDGDTVFDNCVLNFKGYSDRGSGGYITAAQDTAANGYLFRNCTVTGSEEKGMIVASGYLGRPWGAKAKVAFVNTKLKDADLILPEGWTAMSGAAPENANFKEYNTTLLDGTAVDTSKRTAGTVVTENPAPDVSVYFGGWMPKHYVEEAETVAFTTAPFVTDNGDINTPYPGHTLTVGYSLGDANNANDASIIKWYRVTDKADATKDVLVKTSSAAAGKTYKITKEDIGSYIKVVVTPTTVSGKVGEAASCIVEEAVRDGYEDPDASGGDVELGDGVNVFLIGDSTVKDYSAQGINSGGKARNEGAWGEFLQAYFDKEKVTVINYANGGRSSRNFINEGSLEEASQKFGEGDYVFIQFGHNDCANGKDYLADRYVPLGEPDASGVFPSTPGEKVATPAELEGKGYGDTCYTYDCGGTFKWYLQQYIDAAKAKGAIPVLVTPVSRMYYNSDGTIKPHHDSTDTTTGTYVSSNNAYVTAVKQLAKEQNVLLVDGFELTKNLFEEAYKAAGNDTYGKQIMHTGDGTHNNKLGGMIEAAAIASAIQNMGLNISHAVKAPAQVIGQTTTGTTVFKVDGKGKFTAYDILTDYADKAAYWEELGQKMFDAIGVKASELNPAQVEKPTASPANGAEVTRGQKVTLTAEEGAQIRYTTDKSEPKKDSKLYDAETGIVISDEMIMDNTVTIKAIAVIGDRSSAAVTFTYMVAAGGSTGDDNPDDKIEISGNLNDSKKFTIYAPSVLYNKKEQVVAPVVTYTSEKGKLQILSNGVHYTYNKAENKEYKEPGIYKLKVQGIGEIKGTVEVQYTIYEKTNTAKLDIKKAKFTLDSNQKKNAVYTGTYVIVDVTDVDSIGADNFDIAYSNNINAGKATVTITGKNNYYGTKTLTYNIKKAPMANVVPKVNNKALEQSGKNWKAAEQVYYGNNITLDGLSFELVSGEGENQYKKPLNSKNDYILTYKNNNKSGTAKIVVKGSNNFSGSLNITFDIKAANLQELLTNEGTVINTLEYSEKGPRLKEINCGGLTLKEGTHYKVKNYKDIKDTAVGQEVALTIDGAGAYKEYKGISVRATVKPGRFYVPANLIVDAKKAGGDTLDLQKLKKAVKVTDASGKKLKAEVYEIEKFDGKTNKLTLKPAGENSNYIQTTVDCFVGTKLSKPKQEKNLPKEQTYNGEKPVTLTPEEIAEALPGVTPNDFTITSYKNNTKKGNATVTITANMNNTEKETGKFYGTRNVKFKIVLPSTGTGDVGEIPGTEPSTEPGSETPGTEPEDKPCEKTHTVWLVGDSTVCSFDDNYYYPRYGYGTQIGNYLDSKCTVKNLALSGRSSKSFVSEANYKTLKDGIQEGDVLVIGFGHNDEKAEADRYTNSNGDYKTEGSFAKSLYDNYVKLAQDKGAQAILCTPIVRRADSDQLSVSNCHITSDATDKDGKSYPGGDYPEAIRKLGADVGVPVVDLTAKTKALYESIGKDETLYLHAWTGSKPGSVDNTHLNIYGAKRVAYLFAEELKGKDTVEIAKHVINLDKVPSKDVDLVANKDYVEPVYDPNLKQSALWEDYGAFKGTVFGSAGGQSKISKDNFALGKDAENNMRIAAGIAGAVGKISSGEEGFAMYYYKIPVGKTFSFSAKAKINSIDNTNAQVGFGLMARDDMYIDTHDKAIKSDYVAAGSLGTGTNCFYRRSEAFHSGSGLTKETIAAGNTYDLSIVYNGDGYACKFGQEETQSGGFDFQLTSVDEKYVYIGMFASRQADISFSDIQLTVDGQAVDLQLPK